MKEQSRCRWVHLTLRSSGETATGRHSHALLTCWMSGIYLGNTGRCQPTLLSPVCNRVGPTCHALIPFLEENLYFLCCIQPLPVRSSVCRAQVCGSVLGILTAGNAVLIVLTALIIRIAPAVQHQSSANPEVTH